MATVEKHCKLGLFLIWNMASALTVNDPHRELGKGVLVNWLFGKKKKEGWFVTLVHTPTLAHFQLPRLTCLPKSWMFNTPPSGTGTRSSSPPLAKKQISTCHSQASCKKKKKKKKIGFSFATYYMCASWQGFTFSKHSSLLWKTRVQIMPCSISAKLTPLFPKIHIFCLMRHAWVKRFCTCGLSWLNKLNGQGPIRSLPWWLAQSNSKLEFASGEAERGDPNRGSPLPPTTSLNLSALCSDCSALSWSRGDIPAASNKLSSSSQASESRTL